MQDDQSDTSADPINLRARLSKMADTLQTRGAGERNVVLHPLVIYQNFLDELSAAISNNDFDRWAEMSEYPHTVHTDNCDYVMESAAHSQPFFDMVQDLIRDKGITSFTRVAEHAEFIDPSMIVGHHLAYMRHDTGDAVEPIASRMIIRKTTGRWRMLSVTNSVSNEKFPYERPEPSDGILPDGNIRARTRVMGDIPGSPAHLGITEQETDPQVIYRAFLDRFSAANQSGDFETWNAMHFDRVRKHTPSADLTVDTRAERRVIFDSLAREAVEVGADKLDRIAQTAVWIDPDRIRGTHLAIMTKDGRKIGDPVESQFILVCDGSVWKLQDVTNTFNIDDEHYAKFPEHRRITSARAKPLLVDTSTVDGNAAKAVYQRFLDASVQPLNNRDFDAYTKLYLLPTSYHTEDLDLIVETPDELRPFYDAGLRLVSDCSGDEVVRVAHEAEFIDETLLVGHHHGNILRGHRPCYPTVDARWLLRRVDGAWRIVTVTNSLVSPSTTMTDLIVTAGLPRHLIKRATVENRARRRLPDPGKHPRAPHDHGEIHD